ncbi:acetate--CoA ligase family protein [Bordetella sp. 15P40C-2]|uniref:acetate--CoA ligase family protein n=1 Tax=Bordetella sp. 15P40C-2 TaxID=2572246 RepID=UPI00132A98B6|nr:acetate--CoA ligase family protein [Bordetella sp. 15P40C-2]MVW70987.1 CoA-binding protein [Bordetella sp. 15P40C-2]
MAENAPQPRSRLASILNAQSVAVVGASADASKISGRPLAYMLRSGYRGKLYPVNPSRSEVQGLTCYPSLAAIGQPVDLAIIGTASAHVEGIVREGIAAGVKAFVVFSSGFAELGTEGRAMQERLSALAREHGVAVVGPNCLGVINGHTGLIASFTTALETTPLRSGRFSFVSQSGALGAYWLDIVLRSGIGAGQWITTGNEGDVDAAEAVDYLVTDPNTEVIGVYIEDMRRPEAFRQALQRAARAGKPVIAIKSGRSQAGAAAAASHTGALAGDDALYDACLNQYGALRVDSLTEMMDAARIFLHRATPLGRRLAVMSVSGGAGVLIADACESLGLSLPSLEAPTVQALTPVLPAFVHPANPLDITGNVLQDTAVIGGAFRALAADPGIDGIVLFIGMMHSIADVFVRELSDARRDIRCPIIVVWVGALDESIQALESHGIPVFLDIPQAMRAIAQSLQAREAQRAASALPAIPAPVARRGAGEAISEWEGKQWLGQCEAIALPRGRLWVDGEFRTADVPPLPVGADAASSVRTAGAESSMELPYPLVAKLQSRQLLHKSDAGGVILPIRDAAALQTALQRLGDTGRNLGVPVQGVLVEEMVPFDHELLVGLRVDDRFGPVLTLARGGVEAELWPDVVTRLMPLSATDIEKMLRGLRIARLLDGYRGKPPADIPAIARRIAQLCDWFVQQPIKELEINPLAVKGSDVWALDALVTPFAA